MEHHQHDSEVTDVRRLFPKLIGDLFPNVVPHPSRALAREAEWQGARKQLASTLLGDTYRVQVLAELVPALRSRKGRALSDTSWMDDGVPIMRGRLYQFLIKYLAEIGQVRTWDEVGSRTIDILRSECNLGAGNQQTLAELVVDFVVLTAAPSDELDLESTKPFQPEQSDPAYRIPTLSGSDRENVLDSEHVGNVPSPDSDSVTELARLIDNILASLDERQRFVFANRVLGESSGTLEALGTKLDITRERVRQIEMAANRSVRAHLRDPTPHPIRDAIQSLRMTLGPIVPDDHPFVSESLSRLLGDGWTREKKEFLFWVAGPYTLGNSFWTYEDVWQTKSIADLTARFLSEGGRSIGELCDLMISFGCAPPFAEAALTTMPQVRPYLGRYYYGRLTIPEKCFIVLENTGRPMTLEEILKASEMDNTARSVANRLADDDRFMRATKDQYALRQWGLEEYGGIADAIRRAIEIKGGIAVLEEIVAEVATAFGVKETSARAYAQAPMFVTEAERVRLRRDGEPYRFDDQLTSRRSVYRFKDQLVLLVEVNQDLLRGSGRQIMPDVSVALGLWPSKQVTYQGDGFDVSLTWPMTGWAGGSIGSLRNAIHAAGAVLGQRLRLRFDTVTMTVDGLSVDASELSLLSPLETIRMLTGLAEASEEEVYDRLEEALNHPLAGPQASLRSRGDVDVANALDDLAKASGVLG